MMMAHFLPPCNSYNQPTLPYCSPPSPYLFLHSHQQPPPTPPPAYFVPRRDRYEEENRRGTSNQPQRLRLFIHWLPPPPSCFKLNSDGSSLGNSGRASYGGLIRDCTGRWVCGYTGKLEKNTNSLVAEVWGIFQGLMIIKNKNLFRVIVETDCQAAILLITVKKVEENHPQKLMIDCCRRVMEEHKCFMVHVPREGNHCADQLAKMGHRQETKFKVMEAPPLSIVSLLEADATGVGFERPRRRRS